MVFHIIRKIPNKNAEICRFMVDIEIDKKIKAFNAISVVGPKGCGKTRTCKERSKTVIEFQDNDKLPNYQLIADTKPSAFLSNEKPILFDEWQDIPLIWDVVRKDCDDNPNDFGSYYLTGSTSKKVTTAHTGTGRISEINMYPLTIYESGESNGSISLKQLFEDENYDISGNLNTLELDDLFYIACRGGWPRCMFISNKEDKLLVAKEYYNQICKRDISSLDGVNRDEEICKTILKSYARNIATLAKKKTIYSDVKANFDVSDDTIFKYIEILKQLFVLKDIDAWTPQIRSKTSIRSSKKHIFTDPSIAMAALGVNPEYFNQDFDLFGHVFENMVLRDLIAYGQINNATIKHYRDETGLEADAVYELEDGRYALIEIKLNVKAVAEAEKNLLKFKEVIQKHNDLATENKEHPGVVFRQPDHLIVICANASVSYVTENGVKVIPYGCLKY